MMKKLLSACCLLLCTCPVLQAKGLKDLAPAQTPKAKPVPEEKATGEPEDGEDTETKTSQKPAGPVSIFLKDKLSLTSSYGFAHLNKNSEKWRASGMGDLGVLYHLGLPLFGGSLLASFRYAPVDVAPVFTKNDRTEEYKGVVEFWLAGAEFWIPIDAMMKGVATAELGPGFTHLIDQIGLADEKQPEDVTFLLVLGGGVDWKVLEKVNAGPRLKIGVGSFTHLQLGAHLTFAF